jgi:hypothetical protein
VTKILIIEDEGNRDLAEAVQSFYEIHGHEANIKFWDQNDGIDGLRLDTYVARNTPQVLLIHFSNAHAVRGAKVSLMHLRKACPKVKVVVVLCMNPFEQFQGVTTVGKPYDYKELLDIVNV